jgi:hypothetical protein
LLSSYFYSHLNKHELRPVRAKKKAGKGITDQKKSYQ